MIIGLLTQIGDTLGEDEGTLGLLITVPGLLAALSAPLVPLVARRTDRRRLLVAFVAALALANAVSVVAPNFAVLMAARVVIRVTIGVVVALATFPAARAVLADRREGRRNSALVASG